MQSDSTGALQFDVTGGVFWQNEWLEFTPSATISFPRGQIRLRTLYDEGFLHTDSGQRVQALRWRPDTVRMDLFSMDHAVLIQPFDSFHDALSRLAIRNDDIIPGYNCHGFAFAYSRYWIDDDQIDTVLTGDRYTQTDESRAEVVVFRDKGSIVHTALVDRCESVFVCKSGVRGFLSTASVAEASSGIPFDAHMFYRRADTADGVDH